MDVILRRATLDDAAGIVNCIDAAYAPYLSAGLKLPAVSEGVSDVLQNNLCWVLEEDECIVGCLIAVAGDDVWHLANVALYTQLGWVVNQQDNIRIHMSRPIRATET